MSSRRSGIERILCCHGSSWQCNTEQMFENCKNFPRDSEKAENINEKVVEFIVTTGPFLSMRTWVLVS